MWKTTKNLLGTIADLVIVKTCRRWIFLKNLKPDCGWVWLFKFCADLGLVTTNPLWGMSIVISIVEACRTTRQHPTWVSADKVYKWYTNLLCKHAPNTPNGYMSQRTKISFNTTYPTCPTFITQCIRHRLVFLFDDFTNSILTSVIPWLNFHFSHKQLVLMLSPCFNCKLYVSMIHRELGAVRFMGYLKRPKALNLNKMLFYFYFYAVDCPPLNFLQLSFN